MDDSTTQEAFKLLRPICVKLTKDHTSGNVQCLLDCLRNIHSDALQSLQEYVLFPLRLMLKQSSSRDMKLYEDVACCMTAVIGKTNIISSPMFLDLFNTFCLMITSPTVTGQVITLSEELKIAVVKAFSSLMKSATVRVLEEAYQPSLLPPLGHAVTLMLQMAEKEVNRELRVCSILCLMDLALINRKVPSKLITSLSLLYASFVPGISMGLGKVITGDTKQGQKVTTTAIEAWYKIIILVMSDQHSDPQKQGDKELQSSKIQNKTIPDKYASLTVDKSETWFKNTASKLHVLTMKIKEVKNHTNWRVRLALVNWASNLIMKSARYMEPSIADFLEVLVSLVGDNYPNVSSKSQSALKQFSLSKSVHTHTLTEILEENLHTMATQLPRLIRTADEDTKLSNIRLFNGYIKLLGCNVNSLLSSSAHLQRVSLALLQILELDCTSVAVIQEKIHGDSFSTLDGISVYSYPRKYFKLFNNNVTYTELVTTCRLLGHYGDRNILFDHFLDLFHQYKVHRKQAILILNHICEGLVDQDINVVDSMLGDLPAYHVDKEQTEPLIRSLLNIYLSAEFLNLPTAGYRGVNQSDNHNVDLRVVAAKIPVSKTLQEMNSNIMQICLLIEGAGICMKVLGKEYEYLMMDVLYPILEKIGHENTAISQTGCITLSQIAQSCQYQCKEDLLKANADYLVNAISLRMRHLQHNPQAPQVLSVILQHSDKDILPLIEDTILEVIDGLDNNYEEVGLLFMRVLYTVIISISKWYCSDSDMKQDPDLGSPDVTNNIDCKPKNMTDNVKAYLLDHIHQKSIAEGEVDDVDDDETSHENDNEMDLDDRSEEKVEIPYHIQKVKQILVRCIHLLSAHDSKVRLVTLDTVVQGLLALKNHENELLPLVHQLWAPFIKRLQDEQMVVIIKACSTLHTFAEVSKDFIRQRVVKDIFPKLIEFLNKQGNVSLKAGPVYHHSMACKLQLQILKDIGTLCHLISIGEGNFISMIKACVPYLSARQPVVLQTACLQTFQQFCEVEADTVWLILNGVYCFEVPTSSHPHFPNVEFQKTQKNEFSDNVVKVLKYI